MEAFCANAALRLTDAATAKIASVASVTATLVASDGGVKNRRGGEMVVGATSRPEESKCQKEPQERSEQNVEAVLEKHEDSVPHFGCHVDNQFPGNLAKGRVEELSDRLEDDSHQ